MHRRAILCALTALLLATAATASADRSFAREIRRLRAQVERLLRRADRDMKRAPRLERQARSERARAEKLRKEIAAAKREAERAEANLAAEEKAVQAAEAEVAALRSRGEALTGFARRAWDRLARKPRHPRRALVALALSDRAMVAEILGRLTAEPAAKASAAFAALARESAQGPAPADLFFAGEDRRPAPRGGPDAVARMDALAAAIDLALACSTVDAPPVPLPPLARGPRPGDALEALGALASDVRRALRARRAELASAAADALPALAAALGSRRLARAAARAALARGLRDASWEAARMALAGFAIARSGDDAILPIPKAARALLRAVEKNTGVACRVEAP